MSNPLLPLDLTARRLAAAPGTSLGALADALHDELTALLDVSRVLPIPVQKARLTRVGGRCPVHGTYLEFDPWHPHSHACVACARSYEAPEHDDWWAMGAQLWIAERAVHAAALAGLRGDPSLRTLAERILGELSARYLSYPNRDNVLGPTRLFFSTYLESIWLLNVCQALALLEQAAPTPVGGLVRAELIEPSRALIASYDEHRSNRQVWNGVALMASSALLGDRARVEHEIFGASRLLAMLDELTDADGAWYEGENYHLFAHRGFWYMVQGMAAQGLPLPPALRTRFQRGFRFPFTGLLPDECLPSRRDTAYGISIRQWRLAEYLELGYALEPDVQLAGLLGRVYDGSVSRRSTARARSMADAERNDPPAHLARADLSWRALLHATPEPVPLAAWTPRSALRSAEGLSVLRREHARVFVGLEGGGDPQHHGHPDTLALTLQAGSARWLEDPGTGSYVDPSLAWYRSTLAHHAPLVNGATQVARSVQVLNFEDRGGAGWMRKALTLDNGTLLTRTVVVCDGYLVDQLTWSADAPVTLTLPIAAGLPLTNVAGVTSWQPVDVAAAALDGSGFAALSEGQRAAVTPTGVRFMLTDARETTSPDTEARAWYAASTNATVTHVRAPGVPGAPPSSRLLLETVGTSGSVVGVWSWATPPMADRVSEVVLTPDAPIVAAVTTVCGTRAEHGAAPHGWHIALLADGSRSSIDLEGPVNVSREFASATDIANAQTHADGAAAPVHVVPRIAAVPRLDTPLPAQGAVHLAAPHYVRTEESYGPGNAPVADVAFAATDTELVVRVTVRTGHALVTQGGSPTDAPFNALDNEPADVNADGLQWYLGSEDGGPWCAGELLAPLGVDVVRRTALVQSATPVVPHVVGGPRGGDGWSLQLVFSRDAIAWAVGASAVSPPPSFPAGGTTPVRRLSLHLTVNERPPERERRRGQLRLAGGGFVRYLAGPREDPAYSRFVLELPGERLHAAR